MHTFIHAPSFAYTIHHTSQKAIKINSKKIFQKEKYRGQQG